MPQGLTQYTYHIPHTYKHFFVQANRSVQGFLDILGMNFGRVGFRQKHERFGGFVLIFSWTASVAVGQWGSGPSRVRGRFPMSLVFGVVWARGGGTFH